MVFTPDLLDYTGFLHVMSVHAKEEAESKHFN